ncbi:MAG: hypothetical protein JXA49_04285 [Actinobacteria bacterium]|nr:hypothetical protein [Actinomycetota bacterium]
MDVNYLSEIPPWEWPTGTAEFLLGILRNKDAELSERMLAADVAGNYVVINDTLAAELLKIVADARESKELRAVAAVSFGPALEYSYVEGFDDPEDALITEVAFKRIQNVLHELYEDENVPKEVRRRILEGSVRAPQDWHRDAVSEAYSSEDEDWVLTAVFSMGYISGFDEQVIESLESANHEVQYQAIRAAGEWRIKNAWPHIKALLSSKKTDRGLLLAAIEASVEVNPLEASGILDQYVCSDDEEISDAAMEAMNMQDTSPWLNDIE